MKKPTITAESRELIEVRLVLPKALACELMAWRETRALPVRFGGCGPLTALSKWRGNPNARDWTHLDDFYDARGARAIEGWLRGKGVEVELL